MRTQNVPFYGQLSNIVKPARTLFSLSLLTPFFVPSAQAAHIADHLVISEVAYDAPSEPSSSPTGEYIEIFNPTDSDIVLNAGAVPGEANGLGSYFFSDSPADYYKVVNGAVTLSTTVDAIFQFPEGAVIPAHGTVILCSDSDMLATNYFGGDLSLLAAFPGAPQVFEAKQDGDSDGVPDLILRSEYSSSSGNFFTLTNTGEPAILFYWDGQSDLVQDVDMVVWKKTTEVPSKGGVEIDGPDEDSDTSAYADDASSTNVAGAASSNNVYSLQRKSIEEPDEGDSSGNGSTGHQEASENWSNTSVWGYSEYSPGEQWVVSDGSAADAVSFVEPIAVSAADGDNGTGNPADYGADGTQTELYLATIDTDNNRVVDSLYFMVRGSMFGEPDGGSNVQLLLFDLDPGSSTGVTSLAGAGSSLNDMGGALDASITLSGFTLDTSSYSTVAFDGAVGLEEAEPVNSDRAGWRTWGSGGTLGTYSNFSYVGDENDVAYDADLSSLFPGAAGTTYAGEDGFEGSMAFTSLTPGNVPEYIFVVAVTTAGDGNSASPNTLPESTGDTYDYPQSIDAGICYQVSTGQAVEYYLDTDVDGFGGNKIASYCGPPKDGVSLVSGDCDDGESGAYPEGFEVCDGIDNNCDGTTDEGVTATYYADDDSDEYGDPNDTVAACSPPEGYVIIAGDCDDTEATVNEGETEVCDGLDNDCNEETDDGLTFYTYYLDEDGDGYGDAEGGNDCEIPSGYSVDGGDCDDSDESINPDVSEVCDGIDNDCSGEADDGLTFYTVYEDADSDGYGAGDSSSVCEIPSGYVENDGDCDDTNDQINPDATEVCDDIDNDCSGTADDGLTTYTYYVDEDGDTFGGGDATVSCTELEGYVEVGGDCDDSNADVNPDATEACNGIDDNCDGVVENEDDADGDDSRLCDGDCDDGNETVYPGAVEACDGLDTNCDDTIPTTEDDTDEDGYMNCNGDCLDSDAAVYPGAEEICDKRDNDCDLAIDEDVKTTYYQDSDNDGYGGSTSVDACEPPTDNYVAVGGDCNDSEDTVYPGADEVCDGLDNNCDEQVDEGLEIATYYPDGDGDGHGIDESPVEGCAAPDGYAALNDDCDDSDATIYPEAPEICDTKDNDCDGQVDEDGLTTYYLDEDGDSHGTSASTLEACEQTEGYVTLGDDCDDSDATIYPEAEEVCDDKDNDCDEQVDEGLTFTVFQDTDGDGFGIQETIEACTVPEGYAADDGDCDDSDNTVYPGADELCDEKDNNCDEQVDEGVLVTFYMDSDSDGFGSDETTEACSLPDGYATVSGDCDDTNNTVYPDATELCDELDNNCNEEVDEDAGVTFYLDGDSDNYGSEETTVACSLPEGYAEASGDCDDSNAEINPGADEVCDGVDNNCNDEVDEGSGSTTTFYADSDEDGHGDASASLEACAQPEGYVTSSDDCDDSQASVYPGAEEVCDGLDNNCDGQLGELEVDDDQDGVILCAGDCDDTNADVYPGAIEICNADVSDHPDDDCDETTDETVDSDEDGYTICDGDCDEGSAEINPDATEVCDGVDNDCDPATDETADADGDGATLCTGDCDDSNSDVGPSMTESCNEIDDNCDGEVDEGFTYDADEDGFVTMECGGEDCDDTNAGVNPDAVDIPNDEFDQDCSGTAAIDADYDGFPSDEDCDDTNDQVYPAEEETVCDDSLDNDCDGLEDLADRDCSGDITDTDEDGLTDIQEMALGTDPNDADTDDDGLDDGTEVGLRTDPKSEDTDQDGLWDGEEINTFGTDPLLEDTDEDGLPDGEEIETYGSNPTDGDSDDDGLTDGDEVNIYLTNPTLTDSDEDGLRDDVEVAEGCELDANVADTDGDGLADGVESSNGDCVVDEGETDGNSADTDEDGLSDGDEVNVYGTNPLDADTDGDGATDSEEVDAGTDPLTPDIGTGDDDTQIGDDDTQAGDDDTQIGDDDTQIGDDDTQIGDDDTQIGDDDTQIGDDDTQIGDDDTQAGDDDTQAGDDDTHVGDDDTQAGDDDTQAGDDDTQAGDDDTQAGDDDTQAGDDDTHVGDDDTQAGDDDTQVGDDDTEVGDDDTAAGDDDTEAGDDDTWAGDDDTAAGDDDDTAAGDDDTSGGGSDDSGSCSCNTQGNHSSVPAGTVLLGLLAGLAMFLRGRRD